MVLPLQCIGQIRERRAIAIHTLEIFMQTSMGLSFCGKLNSILLSNLLLLGTLVTGITFGSHKAARAETIYGVTEQRFLVTWDSTSPDAILTGVPITGLQLNEVLLGLDFRPSTGELFALGSQSHLYLVDRNTGATTQVGTAFGPLNGSAFGFDFNPVIDRIRVVSDANNNYVLNPNDGTVAAATNVFYDVGDLREGSDPNVTHLAYTNSFSGAATTQLYGIDAGFDSLVQQQNSDGNLDTVGALGVDLTVRGGFDISGQSGFAYLAALPESSSQSAFYQVDLNTGISTLIGQIGGGNVITAMAVAPVPEPATASLAMACGIALLATACRRHNRARHIC